MLAWPFRPRVWPALVAMSLASILVGWLGGALGLLASGLWWVMAFKLASEALTRAASGREGDDGYEVFSGDALAFRQVFLGLFLLVAGVAAYFFGREPGLAVYGGVLALFLPAMVIVLVMEDSLTGALDPRTWFELLSRVGAPYLLLAGQLALLAIAVVFVIGVVAPQLPGWLGNALAHALTLYAMLVGYHALGELVDGHRSALAIDRDPAAPSEAPSARNAGPAREEVAAVAEADRLLAAKKPADAAAALERLIRGRGATAPVHAQYRALLAARGDREGLLRHARDHIAVLLQLGQEREALSLYLESRTMDASFELADPEPISQLIAIAGRRQQSQLAVALYEEFARRFPRDRDLVKNGLAAAQLMDRVDRDDDARRLLQDLLQRFPEHELHPQLEAALQAIRPGSAAL